MIFVLLACKDDPLVEGGILLSNTGAGAAQIMDAQDENGDSIDSLAFDLATLSPDRCDPNEDEDNQCLLFDVQESITAEGDARFLISWCYQDGSKAGAPGRISNIIVDQNGPRTDYQVAELDFSESDPELATLCETEHDARCALNMIHSANWNPDHTQLIAADTLNSRILFLDPPQSAISTVTQILSSDLEEWEDYKYPNGSQVWEEDGRTLLLVTYKGSSTKNQGRIVLWDITDTPTRKWQYPENGYLAAVHNGLYRSTPKGEFLFYAHSYGSSSTEDGGTTGSAGIARYNGPDLPPTYLGELTAEEFGFLREVEPFEDQLLITDSACENEGATCDRQAGIYQVPFPDLDETGKGGGFSGDHTDQVFVETPITSSLTPGDLKYPYEADIRPILAE